MPRVVLAARSNRLDDRRPLVPRLLQIIPTAERRAVTIVRGYAAVRHEFDWKNYQGFLLGTSLCVRPQLGFVGEFDRLVWSETFNASVSETHRRYGYLGVVKFTSRRDRSASGFVQALAGVAQDHTTGRRGLRVPTLR